VRLLLDVEALVVLARAPLSATEAYANDESVDSLIESNRIYIGVAACLLVVQCLLVVLGRHIYAERSKKEACSATVPPISNMGLRRYVLFSACANSFLLGGVVFGYSSAVLMFRQAGLFSEGCACGKYCVLQKERFALVSTLGFASNIGFRLLWGKTLDYSGPKVTALATGVTSTIGLVLMTLAAGGGGSNSSGALLLPGWCLLACGGGGMHVSGFHVSNLYGARKKEASSMLSAAFGGGSILFPLLQLAAQFGGARLSTILAVYSAVGALLTLNTVFAAPWERYGPNADPVVPNSREVLTAAFWRNGLTGCARREGNHERRAPAADATPLRAHLMTFDFWRCTAYFSVGYLLNTFYLGALNELMYSKGDARLTSDTNSWDDFIFRRAGSLINGCGFLFQPLVACMLNSLPFGINFAVESCLAVLMVCLLLVDNLQLQLLTFCVQACFRMQLFSFHYAYLPDRFGFAHFGTINGVTAVIAALVGLASYPLTLAAVYGDGWGTPLTVVLFAAMIVSPLGPILLVKEKRAAK